MICKIKNKLMSFSDISADVFDNKTYKILFVVFLCIGIFVRVFMFSSVPADINQDEAFAGYEAYSIFTSGLDTAGYSFPVYLVAWGSGMNALESYLMIPFIALFGLQTWVIRLPQLIVGILSLCAVYGILKQICNKTVALCGLFLSAIAPWHIILSRWGLESNLAPGFILFGLYFFLKGLKKADYFFASALMYGLACYCYATIWPFLPIMLILQVAYCVACKKIKLSVKPILSVVLLFVLVLPLGLFLLVNKGYIDEIRLPFLSIPKLLYMRDSEISFAQIGANFETFAKMLFFQTDNLPWNTGSKFGLIYHFTIVFAVIGICYCIIKTIISVKRKAFCPIVFILIMFLVAVVQGLLISTNVNRSNILWFPLIMISAIGIYISFSAISIKGLLVPMAAYSIAFVMFTCYYFTDYKNEISYHFCEGLQSAVEAATEKEGTINISHDIYYPDVLFFSKQDPQEFRSTVEYSNYPSAFLNTSSFGRFKYNVDTQNIENNSIYILSQSEDKTVFASNGFRLDNYGYYTIAYIP